MNGCLLRVEGLQLRILSSPGSKMCENDSLTEDVWVSLCLTEGEAVKRGKTMQQQRVMMARQ